MSDAGEVQAKEAEETPGVEQWLEAETQDGPFGDGGVSAPTEAASGWVWAVFGAHL